MAISRIGGKALRANLERDSNLTFNTDTLAIDYSNGRIGIGTTTPSSKLSVIGDTAITSGTLTLDQITIAGNKIESSASNANLTLDANGTGVIDIIANTTIDGSITLQSGVAASSILDEDDLNSDSATALATQQSIKAYVDSQVTGGGVNGMLVALSTPTDGSLTTDGAYQNWTTATKVTDAIDDLNEVTENIRNNTFVKSVDFTADQTVGGAGLVVTLTITSVGNPNRYDITWGDGDTTTGTTDSTPTHTYASNTGSPFDVTVRAYNNGGSGAGSEASKTRENYITIYTATPVVSFAAYAASSGGSAITQWDDGDTVYFENTTTNTSGATVQYTWDWGDGSSDDVISSDASAGGVGGGRIAHTFTASTEQEVTRTVTLTLDSHSTATPGETPTSDTVNYKIYDTHTPTVALDDNSGVNEEGTSGHVVTFTNNTENTIGSYSTYGLQYQYQWGDGTSNTTVNVGSGAAGDTGGNISHTFTLSSSDQANGIAQDYTGNLRVISNHTSSPFISSDFTVHVEPDVRANIAGTAVTVNTGSSDNQYTIYDFTDLDSVNRAIVRMTNTSQNADDYVYDWGDSSSDDSVTEDGSSAGSIGATLDHDYAGEGTANYNVSFTANGTPDITAQTDVDSSITFNLKATPGAPASLSAKTITLSDSTQGTLPRLASGFTDNTSSATTLSAGTDLSSTTARRYTSGTIDTSTASNFYNGASGTLAAEINASNDGTKTFTAAENETGTFTSLVVTSNVDYDTVVSSYPQRLYLVASAKITKALSGYSTGLSAQRLTHDATGNTNYVHVLKDDLTATPTFGTVGTLSEGTGGTKRYISGIPYYNTGSPTLTLSGATINDLVGQAYTNQSNIVEIDSDTNVEGTSSSAFSAQDYTYANIDGASTMLSGGIPTVNVGTSSAYAIGDLTIPITSSSVRTVDTAHIRARNVNGISGYSNLTGNIQVHTAAQSGISEIALAVSDSLGNGTYTDDGIRSAAFLADTTDTPSYNGATNFYTSSLYSEASDPGVSGTKEATIRLGVLKHDVTDYSSGYLPVGPDRSGDTGTQYFTFAFRRQVVASFDINITSSGIAGMWIAAPGTAIDSASGLNGWLDCTAQYAGAGVPGSNTGSGGNGSDGCANTGADVVSTSSSLSGGYTMTLGSENMSNATGNVVLVRIALTSGQSVTALSIGVAA